MDETTTTPAAAPPPDHEIRAWLSAIVESTSDAIIGSRPDGTIFSWNAGAEALYGYAAAEAIGRSVAMLVPPERQGELQAIIDTLRAGHKIPAYETVRLTGDGRRIDVSITASPIVDDGRVIGASAIARSIAERKRDEARLRTTLAEKEALLQQKDLLLKEVNHRVKNGLQMVAGLLSLQSRFAADPEVAAQLEGAQRRVMTVARVHQRLYQSDEIGIVELGQYLRGMCDDLVRSMADAGGRFGVVVDVPAIGVAADKAVLLGLVVNELVTNALRHAYGGGRGLVQVVVESADGSLALAVRDSGPGLPDGFDPARGRGFGMKLVRGLAQQLNAEVRFERRAPGTGIRLVMPLATTASAIPDGDRAGPADGTRGEPVPA